MKHLQSYSLFEAKQFEMYEAPSGYEDAAEILDDHLCGHLTTKSDWKRFINSFPEKRVPAELGYEGEVYRLILFKTKRAYEKAIREGLPTKRHFVFSCAKSLDAIESVRETVQSDEHLYYIIYALESNSQTCFLDMQAACDVCGVYYEYEEEEEVLVYSDAVPLLNRVVGHGETEEV